MEDVSERKTVLLAKRNIQAVVRGGGLQLEIERAAETLAQRKSPGFVDAAAEGRVDDQLHAATFIEEALGDHRCLRGHRAQDGTSGGDVFGGLLSAGWIETTLGLEPIHCLCQSRAVAVTIG